MKPLFAFCADTHLRGDVPKARIDKEEYMGRMWAKWNTMMTCCREEGIPLIIAGDLGNKAEWECSLLANTITNIDKEVKIYVNPGQHDVFDHRAETWAQGGLGVLHCADILRVILGGFIVIGNTRIHFTPFCRFNGRTIRKNVFAKIPHINYNVLVMHRLITKQLVPHKSDLALKVLTENPEYDLIIAGDNHQAFVERFAGGVLISPGSMMREKADQVTHKPKFYVWYDNGTWGSTALPIVEDVLTREHIEVKERKEERIQKYVRRLENVIAKENRRESFDSRIHNLLYGEIQRVKKKTLEAINGNRERITKLERENRES